MILSTIRRTFSPGNGRFQVIFLLCLLIALVVIPVRAQGPALPGTVPDAATGLELYAQRCANCHGPAGNGDGELAVNLPMPPAAYTAPDFRQTGVPADFYGLIVNGNLDSGMPGFGPSNSNPLSEAQVWDVIAAVYALATPAEAIIQGGGVYAANCAACHGVQGAGDGPDAAAAETAVPDLSDLDYWFNRSNDMVLAGTQPGGIPDHDYDLDAADLRAVVDYARTFSYDYTDTGSINDPIEVAAINGIVTNASTGNPIAGIEVELSGYTPEIQEMLTLTTTVDADGQYVFNLTLVPQDWVYLVSLEYEGLPFSSNVGQLSQAVPVIDLPVTVFEQSSDTAVVSVAQVHVVFEFVSSDQVQVTELYVYENSGNVIFVGEQGDPDLGVVQLDVPAAAQGISFQRAFSAMDSFIPATEVVETAAGYVDTIPLRPGRSGSSLVVTYGLPYDEGLELTHSMPYPVASATVILPDVGVELASEGWQASEQETMGGTFISYSQQNLAPGATLDLRLTGEPNMTAVAATTAGGSSAALAPLDQSTELVIGGLALGGVLAGAFFVVRARQARVTGDTYEDEFEDEEEYEPEAASVYSADELVQQIADLDDAYAAGELEEAVYQRRRSALKEALAAIW